MQVLCCMFHDLKNKLSYTQSGNTDFNGPFLGFAFLWSQESSLDLMQAGYALTYH